MATNLNSEAVKFIETHYKPSMFRKASLRRFLGDLLLEHGPQYSMASNAVDVFSQIFVKFLLEKDCFEFWKIRNDHEHFQDWPEADKMDYFMEQAWKNNYENELTFLYK